MGNKKKKNSHKKSKADYKVKKKRKQALEYQTRRDMLLSLYDKDLLKLWFGDDQKKIDEFGRFLIKQEEAMSEGNYDDLASPNTYYEDKFDKVQAHKCHGMRDMLNTLEKMTDIRDKIIKGKRYNKLYKKKDLGIATYLNSDRYKKKLLNKSKYRKELKKIAKREKKELNEMRKLGYIKSKDPDKELNKILKANNAMSHALSDAYTQKHFIE